MCKFKLVVIRVRESYRDVRAVLLDKTFGALLEAFDGGVVPPGRQIAVLVEFATLIVKGVRQFVAHDHAHGPKVQRRRERSIEEGLL